MLEFNLPGIIDPTRRVNICSVFTAEYDGSFEIPILKGLEDIPNSIEVTLSKEMGPALKQPYVRDTKGLNIEFRKCDNKVDVYYKVSPTKPYGFLLPRGSYTLHTVLNGKSVSELYLDVPITPQREDWLEPFYDTTSQGGLPLIVVKCCDKEDSGSSAIMLDTERPDLTGVEAPAGTIGITPESKAWIKVGIEDSAWVELIDSETDGGNFVMSDAVFHLKDYDAQGNYQGYRVLYTLNGVMQLGPLVVE